MKKELKKIEFECPLGIDHQTRRIRKTIWSFLVLLGISALLSVLMLFLGVKIVQDNNHKFCQVITGVTSVHIPKPAHPAKDPSRERQYEWYVKFVGLGNSLGC